MQSPHHVLVVGGGFGGLEAAFYLRKRAGDAVKISLVSDSAIFQFKPNTIYIPFGKDPEKYRVPFLDGLLKKDIQFHLGRVEAVHPQDKTVIVDGKTIGYDTLVLATGATMVPSEIPGLAEYACTIWTPDEMLRLREALGTLLSDVAAGKTRKVLFLVPPNNKCSGPLYEMVFMLDTWLRRNDARGSVSITYATFEHGFIQVFGPRLHDVVVEGFAMADIQGQLERRVKRVQADCVEFETGPSEPFDLLISFPPYRAATLYPELPSDDRGFLQCDHGTRQVNGHPDIYAVGDAGNFPVKQAFLALLQADAAAEHLACRILGEPFDAEFVADSMCIMERYQTATFANVPLELSGDPDLPVRVRANDASEYKVGTNRVWRLGKKMLGTVLPYRFRNGEPFHAGATWTTMEQGLKIMSGVFAE